MNDKTKNLSSVGVPTLHDRVILELNVKRLLLTTTRRKVHEQPTNI